MPITEKLFLIPHDFVKALGSQRTQKFDPIGKVGTRGLKFHRTFKFVFLLKQGQNLQRKLFKGKK